MTSATTLPPSVAEGYNEHMFRIIPGVLELGSMDHLLHFIIGAVFLIAAALTRQFSQIYGRNFRINITEGHFTIGFHDYLYNSCR